MSLVLSSLTVPWVGIDFEGGLLLFKRPQASQIENFIRNFMSTTLRPILFCTTLHVGKVYDSLLKKKSRCINPQTIEKNMTIMSQKYVAKFCGLLRIYEV